MRLLRGQCVGGGEVCDWPEANAVPNKAESRSTPDAVRLHDMTVLPEKTDAGHVRRASVYCTSPERFE